MSQQIEDRKVDSSPNGFFGIYNLLKTWIAKEIIDFDPFDDEGIVSHQLIEQLLMLRNDPEFVIVPDAINS